MNDPRAHWLKITIIYSYICGLAVVVWSRLVWGNSAQLPVVVILPLGLVWTHSRGGRNCTGHQTEIHSPSPGINLELETLLSHCFGLITSHDLIESERVENAKLFSIVGDTLQLHSKGCGYRGGWRVGAINIFPCRQNQVSSTPSSESS